ncbi:MAG: hypothetical protein KBC33_04070 [Candidatus Pacebacteria bacterium]|nr:hypothetical protein [Candidatus Paceibacterota bacterium]
MSKHIDFLSSFYRQLVGEDGSRDVPYPPPEKGRYFFPMPTVNKLWARITFAVSAEFGPTAALQFYAPGAVSDAVYLTIFSRGKLSEPKQVVIGSFQNERIYPLDNAKGEECKVILALCQKMVNESGILEYPFQTKA